MANVKISALPAGTAAADDILAAAQNDLVTRGVTVQGILDLVAADTNDKAGVSANDTAPGYLLEKVIAGTGVSATEINDGGDEDLEISLDIAGLSDTPIADGDLVPYGDISDSNNPKRNTFLAMQQAITHANLTGIGTNAHSVIDTHLANIPKHAYYSRIFRVDPNGTSEYTTVAAAITAANAATPSDTNRCLIQLAPGAHTIDNTSAPVIIARYVSISGSGAEVTRVVPATTSNAIMRIRENCFVSDLSISTSGIGIICEALIAFGQASYITRCALNACSVGVEVLAGTLKIRDIVSDLVGVAVRATNMTSASTVVLENSILGQTVSAFTNLSASFNCTFTISKCVQVGYFVLNAMTWSRGQVISSYNSFTGGGFGGNGIYVMSGTASLQDDYCLQTNNEKNFNVTGTGCTVVSNYGKWYETQFILGKEADRPNTYFNLNTGKFVNAGDSNSFVEIPLLEYTNFFE